MSDETKVTELQASAWDQGWLASKRHERSEGQPKMSYWPNPYRTQPGAPRTETANERKTP